jgi:hypothetical protein
MRRRQRAVACVVCRVEEVREVLAGVVEKSGKGCGEFVALGGKADAFGAALGIVDVCERDHPWAPVEAGSPR